MPELLKLGDDGSLSAADAARLGAAAKACKLVAFPTESGYALGSTGLIKAATRRLLQVKERQVLKPLAVMCASTADAKNWVEWTPLAEALAARFWPGPLALLLKPSAEGRVLTFPEYPALAIRVPAHPAARAMIAASGVPWVWTSANRSGKPTLNEARAVEAELGTDIEFIVDGGTAPEGDVTVIDAAGERPRITKIGLVPVEMIQGVAA